MIPFCQRLSRCWKHFWKPFCESLLSPSFPFLMMSAASQKRCPFSVDFNWGNRWSSAGARLGEYGGCSSFPTLLFVKKPLTKTDRCDGALWRRNQMFVLHYSRCFLLTTSLQRRRMLMYISLFTLGIHVNYSNEFQKPFELPRKNANQNNFLPKLLL